MIDCRETTCWSQDYYDTDTDDAPLAMPVSESEYDDDNEHLEPNQPYCKEDPNPGFCYGTLEQWYYNATTARCAPFRFVMFTTRDQSMTCHVQVHWLCWQQEQLCLRVRVLGCVSSPGKQGQEIQGNEILVSGG